MVTSRPLTTPLPQMESRAVGAARTPRLPTPSEGLHLVPGTTKQKAKQAEKSEGQEPSCFVLVPCERTAQY